MARSDPMGQSINDYMEAVRHVSESEAAYAQRCPRIQSHAPGTELTRDVIDIAALRRTRETVDLARRRAHTALAALDDVSRRGGRNG